jgi:hypothetical protein
VRNRRVEQNHADDDEDAQYRPDDLYFLLMFFIEKHILILADYEKFSRKKKV